MQRRRLQVQLKKSLDDSYDIFIEKGLLRNVGSDLQTKRFAESYVLITDSKVNRLYASKLVDQLKRERIFLGKVVVPSGEKSKSIGTMQEVLEKMLGLGANRKTGVMTLGGGVIGDLGGFCASVFMRGIPYVQIPTTLLAMIDSSVGGKVGVNLPSGKNLLGAFWQPKRVYMDPEVLSTLLRKQWKSGLGEALKYGVIRDRSLWEFFEQYVKLWNKDPKDFLPSEWNIISEMIERCVRIKADVVMKDEKEGNFRQILNYGHTFGHVIELMSDYKVLHGEAVATGMRIAVQLSKRLCLISDRELRMQNALFDTLGIGKKRTKGLIKDFLSTMKKDKKSKGDIRVVLVDRIGICHQYLGKYSIPVDEKLVAEVLRDGKWVTDEKQVKKCLIPKVSSMNRVSMSDSYSHHESSSSCLAETDLQKRLREMRERANQRRQNSGGFLPG